MNGMKKVTNYLVLSKARISALASLSAGLGFILYTGSIQPSVLAVLGGVFLLASGASALNQIQERDTDALMERTGARPLPSGNIRLTHAWIFCICLLASGLSLLLTGESPITAVLGLLAVFIYNGIYTPLKRLTAWAAIPGGLVGAIPPAIGWTYSGGNAFDPTILSICIFFYLWQVPHFWLLLMRYSDDYRRAGLPTVADCFSASQLRRITGSWIISTCVAGLLLALFVQGHPALTVSMIAASAYMFMMGIRLARRNTRPLHPAWINAYMLAVIFLLSIDTLLTF